MWLRSWIAMAVAEVGSCSSDSTPSLGTSMWYGCGPKNQHKEEGGEGEGEEEEDGGEEEAVRVGFILCSITHG